MWRTLREGRDPTSSLEAPELGASVRAAAAAAGGLRARLAHMSPTAADGTVKLLIELSPGDRPGDLVEAVLIPQPSRADKPTSTLCVSTQVGCAMGCRFCATGTMGLARDLSADEIAAQYWVGMRARDAIVRAGGTMAEVRSVVFMGMGDAGANPRSAVAAASALVDQRRFGLGRQRVTLSTVGPSPRAFAELAAAPAVLAWSVHAADAELRKMLVPSTRFSPTELRDGLVSALLSRPPGRYRQLMLAATLIDGVNCDGAAARQLAEFIKPLREATGDRVMVDLIPYT